MQPRKLLVKIFILILSVNVQTSISQEKEDLKSIFVEAESYFLYEEYNEALGLYLKLIRLMPENANINYKLGRCYLHSDNKKALSIPYLEKASKNTTEDYKVKSFKEVQAPLEVFYFLGEAYRVTNQLDKAIETYTFFLGLMSEEVYDKKLVEDQIDACKRAKVMMKNPIYIEAKNLGSVINTSAKQSNAVISGDGKHLVYVTKLPFYDAIFYTEKDGDGWKEPRNLIPELKVDGETFPTCMSYDGTEMYLYKLDGYNGNLYVTRLENGKWTAPVELKNINTKYWESHASISKDKQTLYFTSNRPGGIGDLDIYMSKRISDNEWGEPKNLGSTINTRYNDDTPFITSDGKSLYFASLGHETMGGYDIFVSDLKNSEWTKPKNIGYPINTTSDELFFVPFVNHVSGFMPKIQKGGFGQYDIYEIEIFSEINPRKIKLTGTVKDLTSDVDYEKLVVEAFDKSTNKKISESRIGSDGKFELMGQSGDIVVKINGEGISNYSTEIDLPVDYEGESYLLEPKLEKEKVSLKEENKKEIIEPPLLELDFEAIEVLKDEPLEIKFKTDKGANIDVFANMNGVIYFEDSFAAKRKRSSITFNPKPGTTEITIKVTDDAGNSIQKTVTVNYKEVNDVREEGTKEVISNNAKSTREGDFVIMLNDLISISDGGLKAELEKIDSEGQISTVDEIVSKLYEESENGIFTTGDVDKLLTMYAIHLVEIHNLKQVRISGNEELTASLDQLMNNDTSISSVRKLINSYTNLSASFDKERLIPVLVNLAKSKTNSFVELNKVLVSILEEAGKQELANGYYEKAFNAGNLFSYFEDLISEKDAVEIYQNILARLLLENYINIASDKSADDLKTIFENLLSDNHQLENSEDFVSYIFEQSELMSIERGEIIKLLFEMNKVIQQEQISEEIISGTSLAESSTNNKKNYYWFVGGGLILIIWLILFLRRKNKRDDKN